MYATSEDAIEANESISFATAKHELARHGCRILTWCGATEPALIMVTNDLDQPEAIPCTTKAILEWLGY